MQLSRDSSPIEVQSAQLVQPVTEGCNTRCNISADTPRESATLNADLMKGTGVDDDPNQFLSTAVATPGSTFLTLSDKDGRTWSVLKLLCAYDHAKVLSHPYVVTVNNKEARVEVSETRRLNGAAEQTTAGAAEVKIEDVPAKVAVTIKPRVGAGNTVNMEVTVQIEEFRSAASTDRFKREVVTNANVSTDEILVLGGLIRDEYQNSEGKSPILGKIPVLGWFFKQRANKKIKNNLTVFIRPTIVEPQLRGGMGKHTKHYIKMAKQYSEEGKLFEGLKDPVTRWFFKSEADAGDVIDLFTEQHTRQKDLQITLVDAQNQENNKVTVAQEENKTIENNENIIIVDNDALEKNVVIKLECVAQNTQETKKERGHNSLKSLLVGEENPLAALAA